MAYDSEALVFQNCEVGNTPSMQLLPVPLLPRVVVLVRHQCLSQIDLFKNHLYSIGLSAKKKKNSGKTTKNMSIWMYGDGGCLIIR